MTSLWQIHDILDLEYFLAESTETDFGQSGARISGKYDAAQNRKIYLEYIQKNPGKTNRAFVLKHWLNLKRKAETNGRDQSLLPGQVYRQTMQAGTWAGFLLAFFLGAGLAGSLLAYKGATPINVFTCLWVLLAPQILLLLMLAAGAVLSVFKPKWHKKGIYALISVFLKRLGIWISGILSERISAEHKNRVRAAMGLVGRTRTVYGSVFFWPVFNIAQVIGIGFNIGILAALLLRITLTDLAFGWQSTLQPDAGTVYDIVKFLAAPWAWFLDTPWSHPTAAQIAGSKMVLKDGIYGLATRDLASWWPFLCLSVIFYGLIPRIVLLSMGKWQKKNKLAALDFGHSQCDRLWLQMTTPILETPDLPSDKKSQENAGIDKNIQEKIKKVAESGNAKEMAGNILMVPKEAEMDTVFIARKIKDNLGLEADVIIESIGDPQTDFEKISDIIKTNKAPFRVVIVTEAWQPPIRENMKWIKELRQAAGKATPMILYLTGKPGKSDALPCPPDHTDQTIWQQAVSSLSDPYIRVEYLNDQLQ